MKAAIVRSWKNDRIVETVKNLLDLEQIEYVVVVINADVQNKGEEIGTYTKNLLETAFDKNLPEKLIIHPVTNWGKNPGSAAALNEGVSELFYRLQRLPAKHDIVLNLSVESKITSDHVDMASNLFDRVSNLAVVGIERKIIIGESEEDCRLAGEFQGRLQYSVPQNTAAFWRADLLRLGGGFRTECDFSDLTIELDGQKASVAGMEDFPLMCHLVMAGYKWAMIKENPIIWDLRDVKKDEAKWKQNLMKMKRQERVVGVWAQKYFNLDLEKLIQLLQNKEESH